MYRLLNENIHNRFLEIMDALLRNANILIKIYNNCSFDSKESFKRVLEEKGLDSAINHYITYMKQQYPCFICMLELIMYYLSECRTWSSFHPTRLILTGFDKVIVIIRV